jgi:hypothetical protein
MLPTVALLAVVFAICGVVVWIVVLWSDEG